MKTLFITERLNVCLAEEKDIDTIIEIENHKDNKRFLWQGSYNDHLAEIESDNNLLLTFKEKKTNTTVGYILARLDFKLDVFNLGRIAVSKKGCGYGKESILGMIKYCFENLEMNRFWLDVYPSNEMGINLYESIGMYQDGILRQAYKDETGYLDQVVFSILKEEYFTDIE